MAEQSVNIRLTESETRAVKRFPARADNWAPTTTPFYAPFYSVTHVATGYRVAGPALELRAAEILCAVFDRILPGQTTEEVTAAFFALPQVVRRWVLSWRKGGAR